MKDLKYPAAITIPLAAIISIYIKGIWVFFTPFYVFVMIPLLELLLTQNAKQGSVNTDAKNIVEDNLLLGIYILNINTTEGVIMSKKE